jgi:hypothetical protein
VTESVPAIEYRRTGFAYEDASRHSLGQRTRSAYRLWSVLLAVVLLATSTSADLPAEVQALAERPDVFYSASFTWRCSPETWERILDQPLLMGQLWEAYGFLPAYRFSSRGDTLHVVDPTGLVGDVLLLNRSPGVRTWFVLGKLDHWAVPVLNEGKALFVLTSRPVAEGIAAELQVKVKASSALGHLVLRLARPLLARHVENRLDCNLRDGRHLVETVESAPDSVLLLLRGEDARRFREVFCD